MNFTEITRNKDFDSYEKEYNKEEIEILILTRDNLGLGGGKYNDSWDLSVYFLAYINLQTNKLNEGDGRVNWLLSDKLNSEKGLNFPYNFNGGEIYHLKVREPKDKNVLEGRLPSFYNRFMIVEIIGREIKEKRLQAILEDYRKPINIKDETLGEFELNKDYGSFKGYIKWLGKEVSISLEVDIENKKTWEKSLNILKEYYIKQDKKDKDFRSFASQKLTELSNDWREEGDSEIKPEEFAKRISLSQLVIDCDGEITAYYDDNDMFYGHIITIYGSINNLESAQIEG